MRSRSRFTALTVGVAVTLLSAAGASALSPGTFEETDGNMQAQSGKDWSTFTDQINCGDQGRFADCAVDFATGSGDNSLGQGSKDEHTTFSVVDGSIPNNKSNLKRFYAADEHVGGADGDHMLYLGWVRDNTLGTANMSIEINQLRSAAVPEVGQQYEVPRTIGDLLVLYDFSQGGKASGVRLRLSRWIETGNPGADCQVGKSSPCWSDAQTLSSQEARGSVSTAPITDVLFPEPDGGEALKELTFGEAALNLTKLGVLTPCEGFGQAMLRSRSSDAFNAELKDFVIPAPVSVELPVDVSRWKANGKALTLGVYDEGLGLGSVDADGKIVHQTEFDNPAAEEPITAPSAESSQTGAGQSVDGPRQALGVDIPTQDGAEDGNPLTDDQVKKGDIAHADLLLANTNSSVDDSTNTASQSSLARATGIDILEGTVTAEVIKGHALTEADAVSATPSSDHSGIENLAIDVDGDPTTPALVMNNVAPNTKIDLSPLAFGAGSYVEIRREVLSTDTPQPGTPLGTPVTYAADVEEITMLHVHITDRTPDTLLNPDNGNDDTTDVVVSSARAHSDADGILCRAAQAVEGDATILSGNVGNLLGASIGNVRIPSGGGVSETMLDGFSLGTALDLGLLHSRSAGEFALDDPDTFNVTEGEARASSFADILDFCLDLIGDDSCEISAEGIRSDATSTANGATRFSRGEVSFTELRVLGTQVDPKEEQTLDAIDGVSVVVNRRTCDVGTESTDDATGETVCTTADGTRTAMTVTALDIVVEEVPLANPLGLQLGSRIIVANAHSGATFAEPGS